MSKQGHRRFWRLVKAQHADTAFDGEGAYRFGGRWNSRGHRIVYTSETLALALLEILVHLDPASTVPELMAISIDVPVADIEDFTPRQKAKGLMDYPWTLRDTRKSGDTWLSANNCAAYRVPSALVPVESNLLLNPSHPRFSKYKISAPQPFRIDGRFL